jgi:3-phenylpropionate/trans-cinnamate dioxygenase ferredoxin reductase subunit
MSSPRRTFVIVGGGMTGAAATATLRSEGFDGRIVVIGAEERLPYERPPLSKEYLRGERDADSTTFLEAGWYREHDVDLLLGRRVTRVAPSESAVVFDEGSRFPYDALLLATGGANRVLPLSGWELEGVLGLRTLEDASRLREAATPGSHAVIVGAGFIGCEVAASFRTIGVDVEVVAFERPLLRAVGPEVATVYEALHREHGVRFHFGQAAARFEGRRHVEAVVTTTGARLECDFVVPGVGIVPVTEAVEGTGIEVDNGIVVDERCRTNIPNVFAAGDVANHMHPLFGRRLRVEHYDNALRQGAAAARSMLGRQDPFDDAHWFWSDQYDTNLQYVGFAAEWDSFVVRGDLEARDFIAFYLKDGVVLAAAGLNRGKEVRRSSALIRSRKPVDVRALADEDVDVRKLAGAAPAGRAGATGPEGA